MGGNVQDIGEEPGRANAVDSALLAVMWGALFGTLHAIAVCQAEEIDLGELARQWTALAPVVDGLVADLINRTNAGRLPATTRRSRRSPRTTAHSSISWS
ncbi:hypothetical protein [Mesorhizobium sp.]|uniref:imine reductase family protein n=1 Tax=Mesorhizobium sp. TaxID=1871066 RepID=UPI0025C5FA2E|nr:hypothetical protein [Mesorhizobium sp.]